MVPTFGVIDQVTAVFADPRIDAVNCTDCPAATVAELGPIETLTVGTKTGCPSVTVAVAVFVVSARLIAQIVTCASFAIDDGAVYTPFTRLPSLGLYDHWTC